MSTIMERLKAQTAQQHHQAESRPLEQALIKGAIERPMYVEYLAQRFLIHETLDTLVGQLCDKDPRLNGLVTDELLQLPNLRSDLATFGVDVNAIQPTHAVTRMRDYLHRIANDEPVALLGVYYVFEGSKNGARYIARALSRALHLQPGQPGMRYLDPHGEQQRPLWTAFKAAVDRVEFQPAEQDAMVAAAQTTFDCVGELDDELYGVSAAAAIR
jgi:heme oxygenase